jgi:hypothetical protein
MKRIVRLFKDPPGNWKIFCQVLAHSGILRALSRKDVSDGHKEVNRK